MKPRLLLVLLWLCISGLSACRESAPDTANSEPDLVITTTIPPHAWLVRQIAGPHATVHALLPPGVSPATFQPTDAQVTQVMRSAVYFRTGVPAEHGPWFNAIDISGRVRMIDLRDSITLRSIEGHHHHDDETGAHDHDAGLDPHIWLSPQLLKTQATTIARALSEADPTRATEYEQNLTALQRTLEELDAELAAQCAPFQGRAFFIFHPAWGYFADAYGLEQIPIELEGKEPNDHQLTELRQQALEHGAHVIFVQPQISSRAAQIVADAIGARVEVLDPLAEDVPENLRRVAEQLARAFEAQSSE